jgi:alpha-1,3-glucan synthase
VVHAWLIPIFAISLGAPRWCQTLWSTSGIALYVPILPHIPLVGALLSRSLWLWLGVLDALQGIGFGMILLQTLTRVHVAATLVVSQVIGSAVTILARATAPNKVGPGDVFPNFGLTGSEGLRKPWFWVGLLSQLVICLGFAKVFRKEQLFKP